MNKRQMKTWAVTMMTTTTMAMTMTGTGIADDLLGTPDLVTDQSAAMTSVGETTALTQAGDYFFVAYTDSNMNAVVARRPVADPGLWDHTIVGSGVLHDAHNGASVGVDAQGGVHVVYDIHNAPSFTGHYKKSSAPYDISGMVAATVGGAVPSSVSYARFYRAGTGSSTELYLLLRDGASGNGDEWIKRRTPAGWVDLAIPLISGANQNPIDNPYMGTGVGAPDGSLHLVWTHRISYYNHGVYYAKFTSQTGLWTGANGDTLTLPISRDTAAALVVETDNPTISNNGLGVYLDSAGVPGIVFSKHASGHPEVFHAKFDPTAGVWMVTQISHLRSPRLRACMNGPLDPSDPPRPCDYELQGPFVQYSGDGDDGVIRVFYTRSVGMVRPSWVRPPGLLYMSMSEDGGDHWSTTEIRRPTDHLTSEVVRESSGLPYLLVQETSDPSLSGNLYLYDLTNPTPARAPVSQTNVSVVTGPSIPYLSIPDTDSWSAGESGFTLAAWVRPYPSTSQPVAIVDKGGQADRREYRLLLYGLAPPFTYEPTRVQVLLGAGSGWGKMWHPEVAVIPGEITHLVLTWDRDNSGLLTLYKNGVSVSTSTYTGIINNGVSDVMIGANHTAANLPEHLFTGGLSVEFFPRPLSASEVEALYLSGSVVW